MFYWPLLSVDKKTPCKGESGLLTQEAQDGWGATAGE